MIRKSNERGKSNDRKTAEKPLQNFNYTQPLMNLTDTPPLRKTRSKDIYKNPPNNTSTSIGEYGLALRRSTNLNKNTQNILQFGDYVKQSPLYGKLGEDQRNGISRNSIKIPKPQTILGSEQPKYDTAFEKLKDENKPVIHSNYKSSASLIVNKLNNSRSSFNNNNDNAPFPRLDDRFKFSNVISPPNNGKQNLNSTNNPLVLTFNGVINNKSYNLPNPRSSIFSINGKEAIYSVNTTNGLIRGYNEDRVSIVINIKRKQNWKHAKWPVSSYFSIFDGHGGSMCCDFLKDNLHRYIIENENFPEDVTRAIEIGCNEAENDFIKLALKQTNIDRSGSCGLVAIFVDEILYVANIGDSRIIVSENRGSKSYSISKDHKPDEKSEYERIVKNGGNVSKNTFLNNYKILGTLMANKLNELPYRVYPGGLSVSRSFGDVYAKDGQLGGNPQVLIAKPEIFSYKIDKRTDWILLGCDGVFDKQETAELAQLTNFLIRQNPHLDLKEVKLKFSEQLIDHLLVNCMKKMSYDNLTAIFINVNSF